MNFSIFSVFSGVCVAGATENKKTIDKKEKMV